MSMINGPGSRASEEVGETVAAFANYEAAQKAVSTLIAAEIPAKEIAIVGRHLRSIERVTGRLGYASAARTGALNGVLLGMLFAAILVIGSPTVPIQAFVGALFLGIAFGMLMSIVVYTIVRRRRDFASVTHVVADEYDVTVTAAHAAAARTKLGNPVAPAASAPAAPAPVSTRPRPDAADAPPRYGERVAAAPEQAPENPEASAAPGADDPAAPPRDV